MTAKNKTIFILREPGIDIPETYLRKVLTACPSGGGYAIQTTTDTGEPTLDTDHMDIGIPLADVQDLLKGYASHRILLAFNKLETVKEHMLQPFNVAIDGDDTLLSFAIDGHFPTMVEAGHTEESLLAQRVMFPNIQKLIKFSGGDLDKFLSELRDPTFVDMVMSRIGDRGAFVFLPPTGEGIALGKNKAGSTFPWGQVSDTLGYTEAPAATTSATASVKKGWWGKSKGPEVPVAQEAAPAAPVQPAASPPLNIPAAVPDTKITPPAAPPMELPVAPVAPPAAPPSGEWKAVPKGMSNDQRKKFIRRVTNCGSVLPDAWRSDPFYYWEVSYPKDERLVALATEKENNRPPKDMRAAAPKPVAPKSGSEVDVLLMSKEERSAIETHILNVLGFNAKHNTTPTDIQKQESMYAKFSDDFGIKPELLHGWTPKQLRLLGPKGTTHALLEFRRRDIEHAAAAKASPADGVNTEVVNDKPATPSSEAAPQKKGYWGKQPKAA